ncbi:hypothetical protein KUCAC02_005496 [Chaenocephalus aceratus]|uniref:Uncharacterized protein n=1 Tax=Chaenocephalus aceratus TaxID=36190 RepID=A0ACB9WPA2_CHAAC|nr:hypothetical protein KUCAC02_005496 [Chaenocephalus aceratus]
MGAGADWRAASREDRRSGLSQQRKCVGPVLKRTCFSVCVAHRGFVLLLGSVCCTTDPYKPEQFVPEEKHAVTLLTMDAPVWTEPETSELLCSLIRSAGARSQTTCMYTPAADAVVIHHRDVATGTADLPPEPRPLEQKWGMDELRVPLAHLRLWRFEGVYNLTMTYRTDFRHLPAVRVSTPPGEQNRGSQRQVCAPAPRPLALTPPPAPPRGLGRQQLV